MADFYQFLADNHIEYERHDHPPVIRWLMLSAWCRPCRPSKLKTSFCVTKRGGGTSWWLFRDT